MLKISGVEGPDIPYHLALLGQQFELVEQGDFHFVPLVNHYGTQPDDFIEQQEKIASKSKFVVLYDLLNIGDHELEIYKDQVNKFNHRNKIYLTVNQSPNIQVNCRVVRWDFMWNRFIAYYHERYFVEGLHHYTPNAYIIPRISLRPFRSKEFISLYRRRDILRDALFDVVSHFNGYVSNGPLGITLENNPVPGFKPIDNDFYDDSYFSIYVESNYDRTNLIHLTEKTYDPLIKGHMILPITNPGAIAYLKTKGFELPNEINYSYDNILNQQTRFDAVIKEFKLLLDCARSVYMENADKIKHNQNVFREKNYDRSILQIFE